MIDKFLNFQSSKTEILYKKHMISLTLLGFYFNKYECKIYYHRHDIPSSSVLNQTYSYFIDRLLLQHE